MQQAHVVLFTDQTDRSAVLAEALDQIAPCQVVAPGEAPERDGFCLGVVADVDLLRPATVTGLEALLATVRRRGLPFLCITRRMGERSLAVARALGSSLCLPIKTAPGTVIEALLNHIRPGTSLDEAKVSRSVERAGTALTQMFDAARANGVIDARVVEAGLDPVLAAVGNGGLVSWLDTVRNYDDATYQHCLLVAGLAARFSIDLGFSSADRYHLVRAALVHDVGKARIPLAILNKAGPLDAHEAETMRAHAVLGHEILLAAGGFDDATLSVVRHHHEMLDGSGYPDRLAGDRISDLVRLTTICDIYAALIERRPYRPPMKPVDAMQVLRGMTGKLDADLVQAFARTVAQP